MPGTTPTHTRIPARDAFFGYYPGTVAVVTSHHDGARNVMSAGWHTALSSDPPLYGVAIAPERHSHGLITASGTFAVHFLPHHRADAIASAGLLTGRDVADKLHAAKLDWSEGDHGLPILHDAYLAYVCRLETRVPTGDHELLIGHVETLHVDEAAYDARVLDPSHTHAAIYYGRSRYEALGYGPITTVDPDAVRHEPEEDAS